MFSYDIHYLIKFLFVYFRYGHKKYRTDLHMAFLSSTLEYSKMMLRHKTAHWNSQNINDYRINYYILSVPLYNGI